jgi:hypothetical protein
MAFQIIRNPIVAVEVIFVRLGRSLMADLDLLVC